MSDTLEAKLNRIYESCGYRKFKMSKFEPYDLYAQNRDFLKSQKIITFTDLNGTLLALKPDITLSIIKNNGGDEEKVYYNENVYRAQKNAYRELMQVGVESVGRIDAFAVAEVLGLALKSLRCISARHILNVSDAGFVSLLLDTMQPDGATRAEILKLIAEKNGAGFDRLAEDGRITRGNAVALKSLVQLYAPLREGLRQAALLSPNKEADRVLAGLGELADILEASVGLSQVYLDFSLVNSMDYYNDIIFQGCVEGVPFSVLSGGRYDRLPQKMGKKVGAVGFAVYMDRIDDYLRKERQFDADVLLVYGAEDSLSGVAALAEQLRAEGASVRCMRADELAALHQPPRCGRTLRYLTSGENQ